MLMFVKLFDLLWLEFCVCEETELKRLQGHWFPDLTGIVLKKVGTKYGEF